MDATPFLFGDGQNQCRVEQQVLLGLWAGYRFARKQVTLLQS